MASKSFTPRYLGGWAVALLTVLFQQSSNSFKKTGAQGSLIVVYWGQYDEGTLSSACDTGNYDMIVLSFLNVFGKGQKPQINLSSHCDTSPAGNCTGLTADITNCQSKGISILLSLGGAVGDYGIASPSDAVDVAAYLWNSYLGGSEEFSNNSDGRPLGGAVLDGIDFDIENGSSAHYADLAQSLRSLMRTGDKQYFLTAAPQCPFPDEWTNPALQSGLFDYVWVQFYNNPGCDYNPVSGDVSGIIKAWDIWTSGLPPGSSVLLGLPASPDAATDEWSLEHGYLPVNILTSLVLPRIVVHPRFGGVMLWSYFYDKKSHFSATIRHKVVGAGSWGTRSVSNPLAAKKGKEGDTGRGREKELRGGTIMAVSVSHEW
ncbi:hypothetical protein Mapa_013891 [Marchantia paleacea]|nr:hypothetical protein Mapa_013891 [Marchantia paleacea]